MKFLDDWWDRFWNWSGELRHRIAMWRMWYWTGWPLERLCPQCAGAGKCSSEVQARYGDGSDKCDLCKGSGLVPR